MKIKKMSVNKILLVLSLLFILQGEMVWAKETTDNKISKETLGVSNNQPVAGDVSATAEQMTVIADINFRNPILLKQEENKVDLYFRLENNYSKSEAGIRYGVQLLKDKTLVDEKVYTEDVISVEGSSSIQKIFTYEAPTYLAGDFELWLVAKNESGLPLANFKLEKPLTLKGNQEYLEINQKSCVLKINGEVTNKKYNLTQGVSLKAEETLKLSCEAISHFKEFAIVAPIFNTYERTLFGNLVDGDRRGTEISFQMGEKKTIEFIIEKPTIPQAYEARLDLMRTSGNIISAANPIIFHYVIAGEGATIQKLDLDKISYQQGEKIKATLFWSGSADNFNGSRAGRTNDGKINLSIDISNQVGQKCAETLEKTLEPNSEKTILSLTAKAVCVNPKVKVALKNEQGKILTEKEFNYLKDEEVIPKKLQKNKAVTVILLFLGLLILTGLFLLRRNKNKLKNVSLFIILFMFAFGFQQEFAESSGCNSYEVQTCSPELYCIGQTAPWECNNRYEAEYKHCCYLPNEGPFGARYDISCAGTKTDGVCCVPNFTSADCGSLCGSARNSCGEMITCSCAGPDICVNNYCTTPATVPTYTPDPACDISFGSGSYRVNDWGPLNWSSTNATSANLYCSVGGSVIANNSVPASYANYGVQLTQPGNASCVLTVTNGTRSRTCHTSATVVPPPQVNPFPDGEIWFDKAIYRVGEWGTVQWKTYNTTSAKLYCAGSPIETIGPQQKVPINGTHSMRFNQTGYVSCVLNMINDTDSANLEISSGSQADSWFANLGLGKAAFGATSRAIALAVTVQVVDCIDNCSGSCLASNPANGMTPATGDCCNSTNSCYACPFNTRWDGSACISGSGNGNGGRDPVPTPTPTPAPACECTNNAAFGGGDPCIGGYCDGCYCVYPSTPSCTPDCSNNFNVCKDVPYTSLNNCGTCVGIKSPTHQCFPADCANLCGKQANNCQSICGGNCSGVDCGMTNCGPCNSGTWQEVAP